jgi:uroporphyrinogen-III synthase
MRLLVTRPLEQAARTAQRLALSGHETLIAPVLEIAPTGAALPNGALDLVMATSARAFNGARPTGAPMVCVGEKTAAAGRAAGFVVTVVATDSEALADILLRGLSPQKALYLAGRERRTELEARLRAAGWNVEIVETYATRPVSMWAPDVVAALDAGTVDGVLHYSPRSAEMALNLMGEASARLAHFCLSPAVAEICAAKAHKTFVASQPTEDSLMTLLQGQGASSGVKTQ